MTQNKNRDIKYPNYYYKNIPEDKDPKDYDHDERCAAILKDILDVGDPYFLNQSQLAKKYDVHPSTISRNIDDIATSIRQNNDTSRLVMKLDSAYNSLLSKATKDEDWELKRKIMKDYNDWLFNTGRMNKEPEKMDVEGGITISIDKWDDEDEE